MRARNSQSTWLLLVGFGGLLSLLAFAGAYGISTIRTIGSRNDRIRSDYLLRDRILQQLRSDLYLSGTHIRDLLLEANPAEAELHRQEFDRTKRQIDSNRAAHQRILRREERPLFDKFSVELDRYFSSLRPALAWSANDRRTRGLAFMKESLLPERMLVVQLADQLSAINGRQLEAGNRQIAQLFNTFQGSLIAFTLFSLVEDLNMIVSNIGVTPDLSAIYTPNSGMHTGFIQVSLKEEHKVGSYDYMERVRRQLALDFPDISTYFQSGGLVDSVVNQGKPAPIDIQVGGNNLRQSYEFAQKLAEQLHSLDAVSDVLIPQDLNYPGLELTINREHAGLLGITPKSIVDNVITALTSDGMIAPSFWIDPKSGNSYMLTVQYPETQIRTLNDLRSIPLRSPSNDKTTPLESVVDLHPIDTPTEVDHYQIRRVFDVYVMPKGEDLSKLNARVNSMLAKIPRPPGLTLAVAGSVRDMQQSFSSFGIGLILAVILVYLILMAQFASFTDPFIILLAIPPGLSGVLIFLLLTHTTLNVMSLMGVIMMTGIAVSDSILIVEFVSALRASGKALDEALVEACRVRLRPILMTTLATVLGLIPMALALEPGSEQYAPLARAILGGLSVSGLITVFLVPCAYLLMYRRKEAHPLAHV